MAQVMQNTMPSPALLQRHLRGMHYPASRDELLDHVRSECTRVTHVLEMLPDREYSRPTDVNKALRELARQSSGRGRSASRRIAWCDIAQGQGADQSVVEALNQIPDTDYDSPDAVVIEIIDIEVE